MVESFNPPAVSTNGWQRFYVSSGYNAIEARIEGLFGELFFIFVKLNGAKHAMPKFLNQTQTIT
jgi:hypothetical protein